MKKSLSILIVVALFSVLLVKIIQNWKSIESMKAQITPTGLIILVISVSSIYISNVFSWHLVTKALDTKLTLIKNLEIWMVSNMSRLIPGGIWQYPGRVMLMTKEKVSKSTAISAVAIESLFTLGMGGIVFLISLTFWNLPISFQKYKSFFYITLISPIFIPLLFNKAALKNIEKIAIKFTKKAKILQKIPNIKSKWTFPLSVAFLLRFITIGICLFVVINIFVPLSFNLVPTIIGIYSLSWLVGYIAIFAPGGLGVTEGILSTLLSAYMPFPQAAFIAILFRVILMTGEMAFVFIALTLRYKHIKIKK